MATDNADIGNVFSRFLVDLVRSAMEQVESERSRHVASAGRGLYDREGAAEYLSIGVTKFDELRKNGIIKTLLVDGMPRFSRKDLDKYIDSLSKGN